MLNPFNELANAVILQAVSDYRELNRYIKIRSASDRPEWTGDWLIKEKIALERFFLGEWFCCLSRTNGRALLEMLDGECEMSRGEGDGGVKRECGLSGIIR